MNSEFQFDVFLSHSSKDKDVVRDTAQRLRADGLQIWFDEWVLKPGDNIPAKIEEGLERSRVLVLCMSANAFGSEWAQLEAGTFRFRDPLNKERRFIPLRLDDAPIKGSLAQFLHINWLPEVRDQEYSKLLEACCPPRQKSPEPQMVAVLQLEEKVVSLGHSDTINSVFWSRQGRNVLTGSDDNTIRVWDTESGRCLRVLEGHTDTVNSVACSSDGSQALSGSDDNTLRLWDIETQRCLHVLEGHSDSVWSVAWSPDAYFVLSGADDKTMRLWDVESARCLRVFEGHSAGVNSVAWSSNGCCALSGSDDSTIRVWDVLSGQCMVLITGHSARVWSVAWCPEGHRALSGSDDNTLRVWDVESGRCLNEIEGHLASVWSVAWSPDGRYILSGSADNTVRLWDAESGGCVHLIEGHSAGVNSVTWSPDGRYILSGSADNTVRLWDAESGRCLRVFEGHSARVWNVDWSPDGHCVLSGSDDNSLRLWDLESGQCQRALKGHSAGVWSVAWSPDGGHALSGSDDCTVRVWDLESGQCQRALKGHSAGVWSVAWSPDGGRALSGSDDCTVRVWDLKSGRCLRMLEGHSARVWSVAWSPNGNRVLSGSEDKTIRLWDIESGCCLHVLGGHFESVLSVAWNSDGSRALSTSNDRTLRLWDVEIGRCLHVFEGHSEPVWCVAWSPNDCLALSGSADKSVRVWEVDSGHCLAVLEGHSDKIWSVAWNFSGHRVFSSADNGVVRVWNLSELELEVPWSELGVARPTHTKGQVQYTNAKVLLVGDSGAGKTGLSRRLVQNRWDPSDSTVGAWATHWKLPVSVAEGIEREIWLWDFGGQADQRLIHQLYMEDTAMAVLVFDGQKENLFETLGQWDRELTRASRKPFTKLLVAGRVDAGGLRVSRGEVETFAKERDFSGRLFETSAKVGTDCRELKEAILGGIDWENIPWRSSPLLFKRLKEEIVRLKEEGRVLMRVNELRDAMRLRLAGEEAELKDEDLKAVVGLLAGPGVVWELKFGGWVLLQPEIINAYAQAVIQTLRADELERGCIEEERVLDGDLTYHSSVQRLDAEEERFVLLAMHQTLIERGLCLREHTGKGSVLIFPSYYRRERPELEGHPAVLVSYRFNGFLDDIYATLVVRLHHTEPFEQDRLWRYAADFKTLTGRQVGVKLTRRAEGAGELEVYFEPAIPIEEKIIFSRYVHEHLFQKAQDVIRLRHYVCPHCGTPVESLEVARKRLDHWLQNGPPEALTGRSCFEVGKSKSDAPTIVCVECEKRVPLWDDLEQCFASPEIKLRVRELQEQSASVLDNESKERALVGEVISTVALAGQICREFNVSDHGIDMEIEFKDDRYEATGLKLYLQLKSGDSYLRERKSDDAEIFTIKDERHARYWMAQAFPVLLVIRTSDGEVRWMEVRDHLKRESNDGKNPVKQIVFAGERFDVMSVRRWRDRVLGGGSQ